MRKVFLGLLASLFFSVTFVFNEMMSLGGGSWIWSAALRFLFMVPFLFVIVLRRGTLPLILRELYRHPWTWLGWSTVGFGLFYIPICIAANYVPAWVEASSWQFTIIAGSLLVPLFKEDVNRNGSIKRVRKKIPIRGLGFSLLIFGGILFVELQQVDRIAVKDVLLGSLPVLVAAFAYPLGNRKMMEVCQQRISTIERVFGMTLASLPLWVALSIVGSVTVGLPHWQQVGQAAVVAISSGVIATILFFTATDMAKGNPRQLAIVEATQSGAVVFTLLLNMLLISPRMPTFWSIVGLLLIVVGMILHSLVAKQRIVKPSTVPTASRWEVEEKYRFHR